MCPFRKSCRHYGGQWSRKTTLVNVLCGIDAPSRGNVTINGIDIHKNPRDVEGLIGYVSQDDLLIEDLTVYQNLFYNAKLCFDNFSEAEIKNKVLKLMDSLGLHEIRDMKVGSPLNKNISGGQRKRLNIALELIREPSVLFLDEPTSGLSSRDSENIVDLLKELSAKGKLVFAVIHQPSSDVFKMFNQLLVLDSGGYLIYNGDALDSIPYFKKSINHANYEEGECPTCGNVNAEQVLNIVHAKVLDEYGNFTPYRKVEPEEWYHKFNSGFTPKAIEIPHRATPVNTTFKIPDRLKQFWIFLQRDSLSKFANKQYLLINLLEAPLLALLLASLLRFYNVDAGNSTYVFANNPNLAIYIIVSVIIAFFIGITVSAEEIINDKKILKRESFLNLSRLSYIGSKVFLISVLSAIQMFLFTAIGNYIFGIKGMVGHYWMVLFSTAVFANLLGLIISDTLKKTVNVYILIPFLVIPQLILSGVFVSYDRLNPKLSTPDAIPWYGEAITARWAFEALAVHQFSKNNFQRQFFEKEMIKSQAHYMKEYWVPAIENKIKDLHNTEKAKNAKLLLQYEFRKEHLHSLKIPFVRYDLLEDDAQAPKDSTRINQLIDYIGKVRLFYRQLYNAIDQQIDNEKVAMTSTPAMREVFLRLKDEYSNDPFERYVKNADRLFDSKIIEYDHKLIQKTDPIYKEPESRYLKAHFFAPYKNLQDLHIPTYYANLLVIWILNLTMFLVLYFKIFTILNHLTTVKFKNPVSKAIKTKFTFG
ncbi:MAG: ATP-binding cassette domain-containing protein [Breznakibacter sp.]